MFEAAASAAEFGAPRRRARAKGSLSAGQAAAYERTGAYRHAPEPSHRKRIPERTGAYRHAPEPHHTDRGAYRYEPVTDRSARALRAGELLYRAHDRGSHLAAARRTTLVARHGMADFEHMVDGSLDTTRCLGHIGVGMPIAQPAQHHRSR